MSIGKIGHHEGRSKEELEADGRLTRRVLLRAVAYRAISLAWPPLVVPTKKQGRCDGGGVAPSCGGVVCVTWRRKPQPQKQALLGAIFR